MLRALFFAVAIAVAGFGLAPAVANAAPFKNCTQAREAGYTDIPSTSEYYGARLDSDHDGVGCES